MNQPSPHQPLWYKDAVIYEVHVRAFADSNSDGIGDFPGLTSRLDYLSTLGVTAIWLLPFYPSPLRDDGYDIADYYDVHPSYGTLTDFRHFLDEAHSRNMRVITELVINHTSDRHPWFQRARRAEPGSPERDFYVWSDTADRYRDVRIIFQDTETSNWTWDPIANAYYWHRFFSHQPDLNYDSELVRESVTEVLRFWLDMGVDGVRLDAVPYLYEREGTNGENLPETHAELKRLRSVVDEHYDDRMLLAEANQWPEDAVAYFGDGDECHMAFHFPLMPRLYLALRRESRLPITDILEQTPDIPDTAQWAIFLRNHDELTLEMVTEEDREFMWRTYAPDRRARLNLGIRRRLAPLMEGDRRRIELLYSLLLSLPGTPVIYYGDEIGMGDNIFLADRDGVRTPMQWTSDRNAGFSSANPQSLYLPVIVDPQFHYETVNVEAQHANPNSLLWWVRRMIERRKRHPEIGRGSIDFLDPANDKVLAYLRCDPESEATMVIVANLSSDAHFVELDLSRFSGQGLAEVIGGTEFPQIGELPYLLTLSPYGFYWLQVGGVRDAAVAGDRIFDIVDSIDELVDDQSAAELLGRYVATQAWYADGNAKRGQTRIFDLLQLNPGGTSPWWLAIVDVALADGTSSRYVLPVGLSFAPEEVATESVLFRVRRDEAIGVLYDAMHDAGFHEALLVAIGEGRSMLGRAGTLICTSTLGTVAELAATETQASVHPGSGAIYFEFGPALAVKLYPKIEAGTNPDLELRRYLTDRTDFDDLAEVLGSLEYNSGGIYTLGVMQPSVGSAPTAWSVFQTECHRWLDAIPDDLDPPAAPLPMWTEASGTQHELPAAASLKAAVERADQLAETTAALHLALGSLSEEPDISPLPFTTLYQQGLYQSLRAKIRNEMGAIRRSIVETDGALAGALREVTAAERVLLSRIDPIRRMPMPGRRIRLHGDYRLDEVRLIGDRFALVDLSGDHRQPMSERRLRASPLRDVAEMVRSIEYVGISTARSLPQERQGWGAWWGHVIGDRFVSEYLAQVEDSGLLPDDTAAIHHLLEAYTVSRALHELRWELSMRPDWIAVPLAGIRRMLNLEPALVT